jgi:hypothetical protein
MLSATIAGIAVTRDSSLSQRICSSLARLLSHVLRRFTRDVAIIHNEPHTDQEPSDGNPTARFP